MGRATKVNSFMVKPTVLAQAMTLTESDSGKTYFLNSADGFTVTLPSPRGGLNFEFIVKTAPTTHYIITSKNAAATLNVQVITSDLNAAGNPAVKTNATIIRFVASTAVVGDSIEMISDGTTWWVEGFSSVTNGITTP